MQPDAHFVSYMRHSSGNKVGQMDGEARPPVTALSLSSSAGKILASIKRRAKEMVHRMRLRIFFSTYNKTSDSRPGPECPGKEFFVP